MKHNFHVTDSIIINQYYYDYLGADERIEQISNWNRNRASNRDHPNNEWRRFYTNSKLWRMFISTAKQKSNKYFEEKLIINC